jgi:type I restriction enzyme S subunit
MREAEKDLLVGESEDGWLASTGFVQLVANGGTGHPGFVRHVVRSEAFRRERDRLATGTTQQAVTDRTFGQIRVPCPPLREQRRVAEVLDIIDEAIKGTERVVAKLSAVRTGALAAEIANSTSALEATERHLGEVVAAPVCYGIVQPGPSVPGGVPMVAIRDLNGGFESLHLVSPSLDGQYARSRIRGGDVLVSVKGTIGRTSVVPKGLTGNISRDVARLRPISSVMPEFLEAFLRSDQGQTGLARAVVGTTRAEVSIGVLGRLPVPFPTVAEQRRVVDLDLAIADRIASELAYQTALAQIRTGLTVELLSGRVRTLPS